MQIPVIQKAGVRPNVDPQPQRAQARSVIFPTNYRSATVSAQQGADCKVMLNVPAQVSQNYKCVVLQEKKKN